MEDFIFCLILSEFTCCANDPEKHLRLHTKKLPIGIDLIETMYSISSTLLNLLRTIPCDKSNRE